MNPQKTCYPTVWRAIALRRPAGVASTADAGRWQDTREFLFQWEMFNRRQRVR
jgi:hypothetical protein